MKKVLVLAMVCSLAFLSAACGGGGDDGNDVQPNAAVKFLSDLQEMPGVSLVAFDYNNLWFNGNPGLVPGDIVIGYPGEYPGMSEWGRGFLGLIVPNARKTDRIDSDYEYRFEQLTVAEAFDYIDQSESFNLSRLEGLQNNGIYGGNDKLDMADDIVTGIGTSINGQVYSDTDVTVDMLDTDVSVTGELSYEMLREEGVATELDSFHFNMDSTASFDGTVQFVSTDSGGHAYFPVFTQYFPLSDKGEVPVGLVLDFTVGANYSGSDPVNQRIPLSFEIPIIEDFTYDPVSGWAHTGTPQQGVFSHDLESINQALQASSLTFDLEFNIFIVIGGEYAGYFESEAVFDSSLWKVRSIQSSPFGDITTIAEDHLLEQEQYYWWAFFGEDWLFDDSKKADMGPANPRYIKGYEEFLTEELCHKIMYPIMGTVSGTSPNQIVMATTSGASSDVVDNKFVMYVDSLGAHTMIGQNAPDDYVVAGPTEVTITERSFIAPLEYTVVPSTILKP